MELIESKSNDYFKSINVLSVNDTILNGIRNNKNDALKPNEVDILTNLTDSKLIESKLNDNFKSTVFSINHMISNKKIENKVLKENVNLKNDSNSHELKQKINQKTLDNVFANNELNANNVKKKHRRFGTY